MNGKSARERELFDKLVRAAIDKKDVRKMVQGMAVLARIRGDKRQERGGSAAELIVRLETDGNGKERTRNDL